MNQAHTTQTQSQQVHHVLHDLSNTLTGLLMNAGLLSIALRGNERLRRYADDIHDGASHAAALLQHARNVLAEDTLTHLAEDDITDVSDGTHTLENRCLRRKGCKCSTRTQ